MAGLPQLTRAQLAQAFNNDQAIIRAFEALLAGVQFTPDQIATALAAAAAAQESADAAALSAQAAQDNVTALSQVPFVLVANDPLAANERAIAAGQGIRLTDGGAGGSLTVSTSDVIAVLVADASDSTAAFVDAAGMSLALLAGATYLVDALLTFQSAATTTGLAIGFTLPAGAVLSGMYQHNTTATALEGSYNILPGAVKGNTSGVLVATENVPLQGRWLIKTDVTAGNAQLQFRSEVAASAVTLKAGLCVLLARRIA